MSMLGEALRRYSFWFVDALCGSKVKKYLLDMEKKMQGEFDTPCDDLEKLLNHAVNTTEFYGKFKDYSSINDFPVITKKRVKEKYGQFISSVYKNKKLHEVKTSGSTEERFTMLQDKQKRKRVIAEMLYFLKQFGVYPGYRYIDAKIWFEDNRRTKLAQMVRNMRMFDCSSLSDASLEQLYGMLRKGQGLKCLTGYATFLSSIAQYFDKQGYSPDMFDVKLVVSGAERLEPAAKAL
ncbi:MAG TPA: hypothetical protein ENN23_09970, partial [Deltaproteobacteria bacterium]|nr:hypothetical protein [Deltaproteobacteria bacterium]